MAYGDKNRLSSCAFQVHITISENSQKHEMVSEVGFVFNADKCDFRQSDLRYLGEVVTQDGVKPDPDKV